jgi:regulator of sigma E protease
MDPLTLIVFILAFGGMVIVHEFGHFIAARLCNIEVEEFGIGLPTPGALTLFTWKGTRFTLNWLPLGGFVRPKGENDPTVEGGLAAANPWKRLAVLFAGPVMNLITAVIIFSVIISISGGIITVQPDGTHIMITNLVAGSPAEQAGMKVGDVLISGSGQPIKSSDDIRNIVAANVDKPIAFVVERNGKPMDLRITPKYDQKEGRPLIGIEYCAGCAFKSITSPFENLQTSLRYTGTQIYQLITLPVKLIRGTIPSDQGRVIGLKGIYDIMKQSVANDVQASQSSTATSSAPSPYNRPVQTLFLIAALSISLGVFNLFPFPALDGGRIIFVLPELIIRRRVPAKFENLVHGLGMTLLLLFMLYVNIMDFVKPINLP